MSDTEQKKESSLEISLPEILNLLIRWISLILKRKPLKKTSSNKLEILGDQMDKKPFLVLTRAFEDDDCTLGMIQVRDEAIFHDPIYTLENPNRGETVKGSRSRIAAGHYICKPFSGVRFANVFEVTEVEGRSHILIHAGNTERETDGCILVGLGAGQLNGQKAVLRSQDAMSLLRSILKQKEFSLLIRDVVR